MAEGANSVEDRNELAKLVTVAKLYYQENLTQAEVAKQLGVSRPLVSKMLSQARERGIVHIEIRSLDSSNPDLLVQLQKRFGLVGGLVVPETIHKELARRTLLEQGARYLLGLIDSQKNIGLGWGYALSEILEQYHRRDFIAREGNVYPLIGSASIPHKGYHTNELTTALAACCGRLANILYAPAFPDTLEERQIYARTTSFQELSKLWHQTDVALITIAGYPTVPDEATASRFGSALAQQKAVGSFLSYFYDVKGEFIAGENDFVVHVPIEALRKSKKVIGFVDNASAKAVLGALRTKVFTHLILTEKIAEELLSAE